MSTQTEYYLSGQLKNFRFISWKDPESKKKYYLSTHNVFEKDKINQNTARLMVHFELKEGQKFQLIEKLKSLYSIRFVETSYHFDNWSVQLLNHDNKMEGCLNEKEENATLFKFIQKPQVDNDDNEKHNTDVYYIYSPLLNSYLTVNQNFKRDNFSFYLKGTSNINEATEWEFSLNRSQ